MADGGTAVERHCQLMNVLLDCNKNGDVTTGFMTSHQQGLVDARVTVVSNSNAMASEGRACVSTGCTASLSADDTLNNDYFYDDEFAVPFDAHIAAGSQLCRSLTDSCVDVDVDDDDVDGDDANRAQRGWRGCRLTLSRSESCLYRSAGDSQGDEMMSTSERAAGDFLVSSSELSDLDANQRPLFSPLPLDAEAVPDGDGARGDGEGLASQLGDSTASGEGGVRLRCAMYDATSAKQQYRLSFGGMCTPTKTSSSAEDCARWTSTKTVGSSGGLGLTTWRQVSRVQPMEPGFTTWQRLRSSPRPGGGHTTARSVNFVEWSKHGHGVNQTPACSGNKMGRSGQLLRLYQSSRTASVSPSTPTRQQTTCDNGEVEQRATKAASDVAESRASQRSVRTQRPRRRTVASRTSVDKCVQCLPSFRDRCVQTSTSTLVRADKSLQTSSLSDRVMHSALVLSRPLPDLDFLRLCTSSSATPRRPEVVEAVGDRRHSSGAPSDVDGGQAGKPASPRSSSFGDSGHEVSPAGSGRSSSTRRHHGSDSGLSNNSSSSSGIEPGDSALSAAGDASRAMPASLGPCKPPRSFTDEPHSPAVTQRRHTDGDLPPYSATDPTSASTPPCDDGRHLTCCCEEASPIHNDDDDNDNSENFVLRGGTLRRWQTTNCNVVDGDHTDDSDSNQVVYTHDFLASHPLCRRSPSRSMTGGRHKAVDGLVSPTRHREMAEVSSKTSLKPTRRRHVSSTCHVHGHHHHHHHHQPHHHHVQTSPAKPAKSILVRRRQRSKVKHRSWSDAQDDDSTPGSQCCPDGDDPDDTPPSPQPASRVARPVSLPDATVLYAAGLADFTGADSAHPDHDRCPTSDYNDDEDGTDGEHFRAKKSVSFSEKIFYHSMPSVSPLESPLCPLKLPAAPECRFKVAGLQPTSEIHTQELSNDQRASASSDDDSELPPNDFSVSPPAMSPSSSLLSSDSVDVPHKKDLVVEVMRCVESLLTYFGRSQDVDDKALLGSSAKNEEVGRIVLDQLCPAIHAILLDGLKTHVRSFFGKVKNSAWKVVEDSIDMGEPVVLLIDLLRVVRGMKFLNGPWLMFNAFIFALLNNRALDFWLSHVQSQKSVVIRHYTTTSFLSVSSCDVTIHRLFLDLITAVQPLAQLPFHLEYDFELNRLERSQQRLAAADADPAAAVRRSLARQSSHSEARVDVGRRLRTVLGRLGSSATQSLVLAKSALQATSSLSSTSTSRPPRPLSLPDNLIDLSVSNENVGSEIVLDSSADSVDSAGFFQRFADHMKAVTGSRDAVYCKGVTDYSFRQSPTVDNPSSSVNRSILVQAGFDPADSGDECPTEIDKNDVNRKFFMDGGENRSVATQVHSVISISSSASAIVTPTMSVSKASSRKRWSDFGTRLVGFVDKILLPEVDTKLASQMPSGQQDPRRSESDERLCSLSAAHAVGRRSAARGLCSQSDASDVIQMYSDIGRLQKDTTKEDETQNIASATNPLQNKPVVTGWLSNDTVLRFVETLCHCIASDNEQLSFEKGMRLAVLDDVAGSDWLMCRHDNHRGLVHRACVKTVCVEP